MSATGQRPICQDTGIVNVFLEVGMDVRFEGFAGSLGQGPNAKVTVEFKDVGLERVIARFLMPA